MREDGFLFPDKQETVPGRAEMKVNVPKPDLSFLNGRSGIPQKYSD